MNRLKAVWGDCKKSLAKWWKQLWCEHTMRPIHHSYECTKCEKFVCEY